MYTKGGDFWCIRQFQNKYQHALSNGTLFKSTIDKRIDKRIHISNLSKLKSSSAVFIASVEYRYLSAKLLEVARACLSVCSILAASAHKVTIF